MVLSLIHCHGGTYTWGPRNLRNHMSVQYSLSSTNAYQKLQCSIPQLWSIVKKTIHESKAKVELIKVSSRSSCISQNLAKRPDNQRLQQYTVRCKIPHFRVPAASNRFSYEVAHFVWFQPDRICIFRVLISFHSIGITFRKNFVKPSDFNDH